MGFLLIGTIESAVTSFGQGAAAAPQAPGFGGMLIPLVLTFGIMYFLMIRPQQKKAKQHQESLNELKPGERVITNSGFFGKIHRLDDKIVTLEIANNVRVQMLKSQIAGKAEEPESVQK